MLEIESLSQRSDDGRDISHRPLVALLHDLTEILPRDIFEDRMVPMTLAGIEQGMKELGR